jgi:hypothetical protein
LLRCKKRARKTGKPPNPQKIPLHDKRDKILRTAPLFTYKNNKFPAQTAHFRAAGHGTNIANWQVSTTSPGTPHAGFQHQ